MNLTVPIQINTNLDLGEGPSSSTQDHPNIYEIKAVLPSEVDDTPAEFTPAEEPVKRRPHRRSMEPTAKEMRERRLLKKLESENAKSD